MESISEACLTYIPHKKSKNPFSAVCQEQSTKSYKKVWRSLESKFEKVNKDVFEEFIQDIVGFVESYQHNDEFIPAVTLLTGINLLDNEKLFQLLIDRLKPLPNHHIALVQSSRDVSVKYLIEQMVQSFVFGKVNVASFVDDDDDEDQLPNPNKRLKRSQCTGLSLLDWYKERSSDEVNDKPCLVIAIPDIASMSNKVLKDFMHYLSGYRKSLRFVVVLGISTNLEILHRMIPHSVLTYYNLHVFESHMSLKLLDTILDKVLLNAGCPFILHGGILETLVSVFTYYNFSVQTFIDGFQLCLMNHFHESEVSVLCCLTSDMSKVVDSLNDAQIQRLLALQSVGVLNTQRKQENLPILEKTRDVKVEILRYMNELYNRIMKFHLATRCLQVFWNSITDAPQSLKDIYCVALKENITKTDKFKTVFGTVEFQATHLLVENIQIAEGILSGSNASGVDDVLQKLKNFREEILKAAKRGSPMTSKKSPASACKNLFSSPVKNTRSANSPAKGCLKSPASACKNLFSSPVKNTRSANSPAKGCLKSAASPAKSNGCRLSISPAEKATRSPCKRNADDSPAKNLRELNRSPTKSPVNAVGSPARSLRILNQSPAKSPVGSPCKRIESAQPSGTVKSSGKMPSVSRSDFMKTLLNNASQNKKPISELSKIKKNFCEFLLKEFFSVFLECPKYYPFHEVLFYNDTSHIKEFTSVNLRGGLEKSLINPCDILECPCCDLRTSDDFPESWPDICISYKLYVESGIEINLHDWLQSFNFKVTNGEEEDIHPDIYNRFMQTVREFQLIGLIKPLQRKIDHVKKLKI